MYQLELVYILVASVSPIHAFPIQHILKHCGAHKHIYKYIYTYARDKQS